MKIKNNKIRVKIEAFYEDEGMLIGVQLISGDVDLDLLLQSKTSGKKFKVKTLCFIPTEDYMRGQRVIELELLDENMKNKDCPIVEGEILESIDE